MKIFEPVKSKNLFNKDFDLLKNCHEDIYVNEAEKVHNFVNAYESWLMAG